jgi:hypothetical protein
MSILINCCEHSVADIPRIFPAPAISTTERKLLQAPTAGDIKGGLDEKYEEKMG